MTSRTRATDGRSAVYRAYGDADVLLYVGVSDRFGTRWEEHAKNSPWWQDMRRMTTTWYPTRPEAEHAEAVAITTEHPKYNIVRPVHAAQGNPLASEADEVARRLRVGEWVELVPGAGLRGGAIPTKNAANIMDWLPYSS